MTVAPFSTPTSRSTSAPNHRCVQTATLAHMTMVPARDLRNHTAEILRRVADGAHVTVTQHGKPVAEIGPVASERPQFLRRAELLKILDTIQADAGMRDDLAELAGDTTDNLGPIQ